MDSPRTTPALPDVTQLFVIADDDCNEQILIDSDIEEICFTRKTDNFVSGEVEFISHCNPIKEGIETTNNDATDGDKENSCIAKGNITKENDVAVVGQRTVLNSNTFYSHYRYMCTIPATSKATCPKCFCFICDIPAKDCKSWDMHYKADDTHEFRTLRKANRLAVAREKEKKKEKAKEW